MLKSAAIAACILPLFVASACGDSERNGYHFKPATEWTTCHPGVPGWSEDEWSSSPSGRKWLVFEWSHSCTFPFIGWDARVTMREYYHPSED
jgi:hypothetical protein